ncbi:hypothetical protein CLAFUW4_03298 [Fulvia fulva]|uniref:Uncharacterized protein n=1 Tax=Passalora fulva TaxID=5499 RepID=A0A9Q8LBD6_PASFU|nr:uncharacterized protein CLAFUR5_03279 [Fulvia fulva]KAK4631142.1 hypothetical protein CLAFUR4_03287 [Fulvia fulva]KAK4633759.1 hypothetical protein CLAFUR0_03291 [Fulvia fulva]UJO14360.1 hypothetical protein CLAFUR5_03279 [Fulvia fulva]WPV10516.1 hypothetical protein CLAFUW4_03298 [Fulvia fulva]WPV25845.1 hypothetical protein CLAFUW7_03290 [Fulvia fulva]
MFCLRSWVLLLVCLINQSPLYILLFLSANYVLQRPCVYCSILLFVLVFSLFDFSADIFEPRWNENAFTTMSKTATSVLGGNATFTEAVLETASLALSAVNGTGGSIASATIDGLRQRLMAEAAPVVSATASSTMNGTNGFVWLRTLTDKFQFRIPCLDVVVRL